MTSRRTENRIELRGLPGPTDLRGAVVVLNKATRRDLERSRELAATIVEDCLLVAVDGGLDTCLAAGRRPDLFVGDGDSAGELPDGLPAVHLPTDKEFSDLAGALVELRRRKVAVVGVAGLVGGRLDHEWANLFELGRHARFFAGLLAPTDRGTVLVTRHGCRSDTRRGRTISLFAMGGGATVTLLGPRWEMRQRRIPPGSLGLSNESGTEVDLTVHSGTVALIWIPGEGES